VDPRRGWQDEILEAVPSGVDGSQIAACLKLSPTERLERMRHFMLSLELARKNHGTGLPNPR
jgi:hypothetical protein